MLYVLQKYRQDQEFARFESLARMLYWQSHISCGKKKITHFFFFSKPFIEVYTRLLESYLPLKPLSFTRSRFDIVDSIEGSSEFLFDSVGWEIQIYGMGGSHQRHGLVIGRIKEINKSNSCHYGFVRSKSYPVSHRWRCLYM